jgi:hypothetical protein
MCCFLDYGAHNTQEKAALLAIEDILCHIILYIYLSPIRLINISPLFFCDACTLFTLLIYVNNKIRALIF